MESEMMRSLKLLTCAFCVTLATTACSPTAQTSGKDAANSSADDNMKVIAVSDIPGTSYKMVEYEVMYDTNRVVHCVGLKSTKISSNFEQNSLSCDWERSRWDGIH
mgnify:CR=1 FL=1